MTFNPHDTLDVFSRTLWAEARNQIRLGIEAVASVILNRAAHPRWWGTDVRSVCLMPSQFSCWLPSDPQAAAIRGTDIERSVALVECIGIARIALAGRLVDPTNGADSYANLSTSNPVWARGVLPCAKIGAHTFFRLEIPAPRHAAVGTPQPAPAFPVPMTPSVFARAAQPAHSGGTGQASDAADLNDAELQRIQAIKA